MATERYASYKGRTYKLLFRGKTKFGPDKAKLAFLDGSKEFWVDGSLISETNSPASRGRSKRDWEEDACELCGRNKYTCGHCIGW